MSGSSNSPKSGALLELESSNRALLLTRVSLTSTTSWGLNGSAPAEGGYTVYNTNAAITGSNDYPVIPDGVGVYYWDGTGWVAVKRNTTYREPWNVQGTTTPATLNSQNIYQSGTVAIGTNQVYDGATLHVNGAIRGGTNPQGTVGANSFAMGNTNEASGPNSIAMGLNNQATGNNTFVVGYGSKATALRSMAMGYETTSSGENAVAMGNTTTASGANAVAFGYNTTASGNNGTAFGLGTRALGTRATAFGNNTLVRAAAEDATAFGRETIAGGNNSTAFGRNSEASGTNSTAFGYGTTASGDRSTAFGNEATASGSSSTAFGLSTRATNMRATAFGSNTLASGETATAFGAQTEASGLNSTSFGYQTKAVGNNSTAMGNGTTARGANSLAAGNGALTGVDANNAISMGNSTSALHVNSLVLGNNVTSNADNQFTARFQGGYRFMTQAQSVSNIGAQLASGANAWSTMSSKSLKENFQPVDGQEVLAKIVDMELTSWNYIGQDKTQFRHYGPMAEDFYAAFGHDGIGTIGDSESINQADFDGINLIAIQALAKENQELKARIEALEKQLQKRRRR